MIRLDPLADDPRVLGRDHDVLRERAVRVDAEDPQVPADVRASRPAGRADAARDVGLGRDEGPRLHVVDLGTDRLDVPGDLVTERHRHAGHPTLGPLVPVVDVQVGPADRRGVHPDEHLALAGIGDRDVLELGAGARCGLAQGAHRAQPSATRHALGRPAVEPWGPSGAVQAGLDGRRDDRRTCAWDGSVWRSRRGLIPSACGRLANDDRFGGTAGATGATGSSTRRARTSLVLRMANEGGFVPDEFTLGSTPFWSLFGDGTLIVPGPQIEIYPGPALPNLTATPVSEEGIQAILRGRARGRPPRTATRPTTTSASPTRPTTTFTVVADGPDAVSAYALGVGEPAGTCGSGEDAEARAKLAAFPAKLGDLASWLPEGSIGTERAVHPTEMRVYVLPYQGDPELRRARSSGRSRPRSDASASPVQNVPAATRCGVVAGADLDDAARARRRTRTSSRPGRAAGPSTG